MSGKGCSLCMCPRLFSYLFLNLHLRFINYQVVLNTNIKRKVFFDQKSSTPQIHHLVNRKKKGISDKGGGYEDAEVMTCKI